MQRHARWSWQKYIKFVLEKKLIQDVYELRQQTFEPLLKKIAHEI